MKREKVIVIINCFREEEALENGYIELDTIIFRTMLANIRNIKEGTSNQENIFVFDQFIVNSSLL